MMLISRPYRAATTSLATNLLTQPSRSANEKMSIEPTQPAGRAHPTVAPAEPPCAEWGPLSAYTAIRYSSDEDGAVTGSDGEPLADGAAAADGVEPMRSRVGAKAVKSPVRPPARSSLLAPRSGECRRGVSDPLGHPRRHQRPDLPVGAVVVIRCTLRVGRASRRPTKPARC